MADTVADPYRLWYTLKDNFRVSHSSLDNLSWGTFVKERLGKKSDAAVYMSRLINVALLQKFFSIKPVVQSVNPNWQAEEADNRKEHVTDDDWIVN